MNRIVNKTKSRNHSFNHLPHNNAINNIYNSLDLHEKQILQQRRLDCESSQNILFTNLQSYISYLAAGVIERKHQGEFVPRNIEEARAGTYL